MFNKTRGVNQGCPISPFCYLAVRELISQTIKNNKDIEGIKIGSKITNLLSQFVDDTALFIKYSKVSLEAVLDNFEYIEAQTGLKISYEKTIIYRIGTMCDSNAKLYTKKALQWTDQEFKLLRITISNDVDIAYHNHEESIAHMEEVCNTWKDMSLSIMGKVLIVNTLMESLFVYKLNALPNLDEHQSSRIEKIISKFIWEGKKPKITLKTLQAAKENGGLRLFDIRNKQKALKVQWVKRIESNVYFKESFLLCFPWGKMKEFWECNIHKSDVKQLIKEQNVFWKEVFESWCEIHYHDPQNRDNVLNQIIWLNSDIKQGNKMFINEKAMRLGPIRLEDICDDQGNILNFAQLNQKYPGTLGWLEYLSITSAI